MRPFPTRSIEVPTADAFAVRGDLYLPPASPPSAAIILCHGFKGFRRWGFFPYLAGRLRDAGLVACVLDFSFNGTNVEVEGAPERPAEAMTGPRFARPDLFRMNTLGREISDLAFVLRAAGEDGFQGAIDPSLPIGLFSHSRGAIAAMVNACENGGIRALCTWSAPDHPDRFTARQKTIWRRCGDLDFTDAVDGTPLSLSVAYLDDLERNRESYDLRRRAAALEIPYLIVHGEMDLAVPPRCAHALYDAGKGRDGCRLLVFRTGHTFGVNDPPGMDNDRPSAALSRACDATVEWFEGHLTRGRRGNR